jgi:ATP-binding cassette subfamily B protein RaxB
MLPIYIDKLVDIFHSPLEKNVIEQQPLISSDLAIKVVNLSFRHSPYDQWLFRSLNFTITKGETVVFIGASGSGKSSLIKVLMGLLQPGEGKVLVNHLFTSQAKESIPRFAAVMQNDVLLSGTIAENISFFSDYPDRQKIESCARIAMIWDDIQKWPLQLSTMVGEMGASLSGGQRQRILLARALYVDPDILFLDEATSHLDEPTEHVINKNLKMLGKTCIMVAHRANTIAMADRMIDLTPYLSSVTAA